MLSRPLKIALALGSVVGLLTATIAVNARLSWRPVSVDFGVPPGTANPHYLPITWQNNDLWLLAGVEGTVLDTGKTGSTPWRVARNWNRKPIRIIQKALYDRDIVASSPTNSNFARSDGNDRDKHLQLWQGDKVLGHLKEREHHNRLGVMKASRPRLFSFSPDGKRLVADSELFGYSDYAEVRTGFRTLGLVLFDVKKGKQIARQNTNEGGFTDFAWSPDSQEVACMANDGWVFVVNGQSGKVRLKFRAHQLFGAQIAWAPNGKTLATATNPRLVLSLTGLKFFYKGATGAALSSPGGTLTLTEENGKGKLFVASDASGDTTWNGRTERALKRFDARTGKPIGSPLLLQTGAVDLAFSPDGRQLALGEHEFALLLNAQTLRTERRLDVPSTVPTSSGSIPAPVCVAWSADSATLATSTERGLTLWRTR